MKLLDIGLVFLMAAVGLSMLVLATGIAFPPHTKVTTRVTPTTDPIVRPHALP